MNSVRNPLLRLVIAGAATSAAVHSSSAETIVLRWDPGVESVILSDISGDVPPLWFHQANIVGGGFTTVGPGVRPEGWNLQGDCPPPPFAGELAQSGLGTQIGTPIDPAQPGWMNAYSCFEFDTNWPILLNASNDMSCSLSGCPFDFSLFGTDQGVYVTPLRFEDDQGEWHAAWIAIRVSEDIFPDCNACDPNPPADLTVASFAYIGFGYETEADTPIINGGGLCESDLDQNAVLDLADVQVFAQSFLAAGSLADLNSDGVFDLADIQQFIGSFNTGCGL